MEGTKANNLPIPSSADRLAEIPTCSICCENQLEPLHVFSSRCGHGCCKVCIRRWIEKEETTGQVLPTCPFCRCNLDDEAVITVIGRNFLPKGTTGLNCTNNAAHEMDDLTMQFIQEQTRPCPCCGIPIMKLDGCDLMECLCGFRYCYACGSPRAQCDCTPAHHYFWDNILDQSAPRQPPVAARIDQETRQITNLASYLRREKARRKFVQKHRRIAVILESSLSEKRKDLRCSAMLDDEAILDCCYRRRKFVKKSSHALIHLRSKFARRVELLTKIMNDIRGRFFGSPVDIVMGRLRRDRSICSRKRFHRKYSRFHMKFLKACHLQKLKDMKSVPMGEDDQKLLLCCIRRRKFAKRIKYDFPRLLVHVVHRKLVIAEIQKSQQNPCNPNQFAIRHLKRGRFAGTCKVHIPKAFQTCSSTEMGRRGN